MMKPAVKGSLILSVLLILALCLPACGGSSSGASASGSSQAAGSASAGFTGGKYVYDGEVLSTPDLPENYTPLTYDTFVGGFRFLADEASTSSTYNDVAAAFGDDGIRMDGMKYEGYAYYVWYSDKEYIGDSNVSVLVTFKDKDGTLTYYSYTSSGILPEDVR